MAVYAVTFDGARFWAADTYTSCGNYGGSGAGGAAEAPIAYHNGLACNRKQSVTGGTLGGLDYDPAAGAIDHTGATRRLAFVKAIISDSFDCNTSEGMRITMGSASTATHKYNLAGSTATNDAYLAYPAQGGYVLTAIDVTETFWPITTTGTIDTTAIDYYGIQGSWITGQAKAENIAIDAVDVGTGLYLVGGTGADPQAELTGYVAKDQDITTNRWGCVSGAGSTVNAWCVLRAGGAIELNDSTSIVNFKDGYHSAGLTGILHELDTAASTFDVGATFIGEGKLYNAGAIDTRPDYTVTGTTMTADYNLTGVIRNFRNVVLNSKVHADGAAIEAQLLTQATAHIENCTIKTTSLTSIATLQDPTFGISTGLHDTDFIQAGAGHAIELSGVGSTYAVPTLTFTGYGADTTDSAALDITAATGTTTIEYSGTAPTYKTAGATVVLSANPVNLTLTGIQADSSANITGGAPSSEVRIYEAGTTTEIDGIEDVIETTGGSKIGTFTFTYTYVPATDVDIVIHHHDYQYLRLENVTLGAGDASLPIQQIFDRNYSNP